MSFACSDLARVGLMLALGLLASCSSLEMQLPKDFLRVDDSRPELRASTPKEAVLLVREFRDADGGTLEFWDEALHNDLVESRGYVATGQAMPMQDADGVAGVARLYETALEGRTHGYLCALFVLGDEDNRKIRVAEFVAPSAEFTARSAEVLDALSTLTR